MNNVKLKTEILERFKPVIASWDASDIYAISLFVYDADDNPLEPTVTLGYNTEEGVGKEMASGFSSEGEARWNYANWLQNEEFFFGQGWHGGQENGTGAIVKEWVAANNLDDINVTGEFVSVLIDVVKELHATGFIQNKFGKPIPIIIHELEYYDQIAEQNKLANPHDIIKDFANWIEGMYG